MPTIHSVAKWADVSSITVSCVINDSGPVSEHTRNRIEAAIAELNYVPHRLARRLRAKRTNVLALVVTGITNPPWYVVSKMLPVKPIIPSFLATQTNP